MSVNNFYMLLAELEPYIVKKNMFSRFDMVWTVRWWRGMREGKQLWFHHTNLRLPGSKIEIPDAALRIFLNGHSGNVTVCLSNVPISRNACRSGLLVWTDLFETKRETFSDVTAGFNDKFTSSPEPVLLELTGDNYCFGRRLLPLSQQLKIHFPIVVTLKNTI